jgi:hypothetical protein
MLPHFSSFLRICFFKKEKKPNFPDLQHCCQQVHPANGTVEGMYLFPVKKRTMLLIQPFPFRDQLCPVLALFSELVCQSSYLPVLKGYLPVIRYEQDPVIRNGFLTISCPDTQVVRLKADVGTAYV